MRVQVRVRVRVRVMVSSKRLGGEGLEPLELLLVVPRVSLAVIQDGGHVLLQHDRALLPLCLEGAQLAPCSERDSSISAQVKSSQVKSSQVKSSQVKSRRDSSISALFGSRVESR